MSRKAQKVKVYGLDSTKSVRARLIEILQERVMYHKDKFIAPILHQEMQSMEVKKNGKVEHSDNSHDDNVFSYLMAMYVWYDGQNLMENFHIRKGTIQTDEDKDIETFEIEDSLEKREQVDFRSSQLESNEEIAKELDWIENSKYVTSEDIKTEQYFRNIELKANIVNTNDKLSDSIEVETGINPMVFNQANIPGFTSLPNDIYMMDEYPDTDWDDGSGRPTNSNSVLQGNLSSFYDLV